MWLELTLIPSDTNHTRTRTLVNMDHVIMVFPDEDGPGTRLSLAESIGTLLASEPYSYIVQKATGQPGHPLDRGEPVFAIIPASEPTTEPQSGQ
jgi:hypothetical protein